jgi:hypothetical protein
MGKNLKRKSKTWRFIVESIFKHDENDLSYITKDKDLLKQHIRFITNSQYSKNEALDCYIVPDGHCKGSRPKYFIGFKKFYKIIFDRWTHLLKCTLDKDYLYYKFFGGKGIYITQDFLDAKKFCIWCLKNGLTGKLGTFTTYLLRKRDYIHFSSNNCYVVTEKDLHECKSLKMVLNNIYVTKKYEEGHDPTVSYLTMYTRYYVYSLSLQDALYTEYKIDRKGGWKETIGFSPKIFYTSVATESDVPESTFLSRIHYSYLNGGFIVRPYDMLKEDFSVDAEAAKQGKVSYKRQWNINNKEREKRGIYSTNTYNDSFKNKSTDNETNSTIEESNVYSNKPDDDVYNK